VTKYASGVTIALDKNWWGGGKMEITVQAMYMQTKEDII